MTKTSIAATPTPTREDEATRLLLDPRVQELLASRRRRYIVLSAIVSALYAAVAIGCAFAPDLMGQPVVGSSISVGVVSMALVMVVGIASSGYYTWWANTVRDPMTQRIVQSDPRMSG